MTRTPLIDSHIHLQDTAFDADRQAVIDQACQLGVTRFVCNGTSPEDWAQVAALAQADARVIPCFGLHPWYVSQHNPSDWVIQLKSLLTTVPSCVGEIGLDRWIKDHDMKAQAEAFTLQLSLARDLNRPVMIHCLRAWGDLLTTLDSFGVFPAGLMIHGFGGAADLIEPLNRFNVWFSFAGQVLDDRKTRAREALLRVPEDRLLIETDAPDMPPPESFRQTPHRVSHEGRYRNDPGNLPAILEGIAKLRHVPCETLAKTLYHNTRHFLKDLL